MTNKEVGDLVFEVCRSSTTPFDRYDELVDLYKEILGKVIDLKQVRMEIARRPDTNDECYIYPFNIGYAEHWLTASLKSEKHWIEVPGSVRPVYVDYWMFHRVVSQFIRTVMELPMYHYYVPSPYIPVPITAKGIVCGHGALELSGLTNKHCDQLMLSDGNERTSFNDFDLANRTNVNTGHYLCDFVDRNGRRVEPSLSTPESWGVPTPERAIVDCMRFGYEVEPEIIREAIANYYKIPGGSWTRLQLTATHYDVNQSVFEAWLATYR